MNTLLECAMTAVSAASLAVLAAVSPRHARDALRVTAGISVIIVTLALTIHTTRG